MREKLFHMRKVNMLYKIIVMNFKSYYYDQGRKVMTYDTLQYFKMDWEVFFGPTSLVGNWLSDNYHTKFSTMSKGLFAVSNCECDIV